MKNIKERCFFFHKKKEERVDKKDCRVDLGLSFPW